MELQKKNIGILLKLAYLSSPKHTSTITITITTTTTTTKPFIPKQVGVARDETT
jgi:hypothetical protein